MQSDDKYTDNPDDFSREVGEKLREHQMPVGSDIWNSLAEKLQPRKGRVIVFWPWAAAGVAAVALVWFFLLNPWVDEPLLTQNSSLPEQAGQLSIPLQSIPHSKENHANKELITKQTVNEDSDKLTKKEKERKRSKHERAVNQQNKVNENGVGRLTKISETEESEESAEIIKSQEVAESIESSMPEETMPLAENLLSSPIQKHRKQYSLMAALGSGNALLDLSLENYNVDNPIFGDYSPGDKGESSGGIGSGVEYNLLSPEDYTNIEHRPPVSFSLMVDFPIDKNISLEAGLSYTYLFSRFSRNDHFIYRATLQQHYVGVPLNLKYTMWQNDAWRVYLFGGGSIEKGLRSVYKQRIERNGGVVYHTNVHGDIDGFQFSAQGGAGFSYRLRDNLALFGEPRIVYYFQNNQPMSSRTENPLIFGLNMGIRIQFK